MSFKRQAHAVLDLPSRRGKALKIQRLLGLDDIGPRLRLLEIGTGSGGIAHYFASLPGSRFLVSAVDVEDLREVREGYAFHRVEGTALPFGDATFDVVISNHVIEHVGDRGAQLEHLRELRRVMSDTAVAYLAVPNRWMLVEPHYRLALLSWLPRRLRTPYLRLRGRGRHYDCEPLSLRELDALLGQVGVRWRHVEVQALRETLAIEGPGPLPAWLAGCLPDAVLELLRAVIPTLICVLRKPPSMPSEGCAP